MPYTLMKGLGWFLAALLLGILIGWLLRSIAATRQMRKMRAVRADHTELDRLRARNANLDPVVAERDRLAAERDRLAAERDRLAAELASRTDPSRIVIAPAPAAVGADSADVAVGEAEIEANDPKRRKYST